MHRLYLHSSKTSGWPPPLVAAPTPPRLQMSTSHAALCGVGCQQHASDGLSFSRTMRAPSWHMERFCFFLLGLGAKCHAMLLSPYNNMVLTDQHKP
ncbi:unnamed protein product [Urochloa humidicola]